MEPFRAFGLKVDPFSTTPDPRFAFQTQEHRLALLKLQYAVMQRQGLALLQGEIGAGKTTIARLLADDLEVRPEYIINSPTRCDFRGQGAFLSAVCEGFGLPRQRYIGPLYESLAEYLAQMYVERKVPVLLLDEAQTIHSDNLNMLHQLWNLHTDQHKLLQMVLFAQPNMAKRLDKIPALQSRITVSAFLERLTIDDAMNLLRYRVAVASGSEDTGLFDRLFPEELHDTLYQAAGLGIPRALCVLCADALFYAHALAAPCVTRPALQRAIEDYRRKSSKA